MIQKFLEKRDFPMRDFLNELNKKELLFFHFLLSYNQNEVEEICSGINSIEDFYSRIKSISGANLNLKKLPKEDLVDSISQEYNSTITTLVYKLLYDYEFNLNDAFIHPKVVAIDRFVNTLFMKNIENMIKDLMTKGIDSKYIQKEFEKCFCFSNRPVINSIGLTSMIGKIDSSIQNIFNGKSTFILKFREEVIGMLFESFYYLKINENMELNKEKQQIEVNCKRLEDTVSRQTNVLEKQKESNRKLTSELKELEKKLEKEKSESKSIINNELLTQLYSDLQKKDIQIERLTKSIKDIKEKPITRYNTMIENLNTQILDLKRQNKERQLELREYRKKVEELQNKKVEDILIEYLKNKGLTPSIYNIIESYLLSYQEQIQQKDEASADYEKKVSSEPAYKIGYCEIEENTHYVVFPDKTKVKIINLPESTYVGEWQFVKVTQDGTFKWAYGYKYEEHEVDYLIAGFAWVSYRGSDVFACKPSGECFKLERIPEYIQLKENQIISFDSKNQLLRFYRNIRHNADEYIKSIKAKEQKILYVLKSFTNGVLTRDIETDVEEFKVIDTDEKDIKEQQIVCMKGNEIVNIFNSSKFYTFSTYYNHAELGMIEKKNDTIFIRKLSGEVAIVNDIPITVDIEDGQIIKVDEFNNFLFIKREEPLPESIDDNKKRHSPIQRKTSMDKIEIEKDVLIVGKITYENSYKMALYKNGYRAEIVDGFSSWSKIKAATKDKDCVIVVTDFISHENMWKIKDEILEIPVIYSEFNGANRICEKISNLEFNKESI